MKWFGTNTTEVTQSLAKKLLGHLTRLHLCLLSVTKQINFGGMITQMLHVMLQEIQRYSFTEFILILKLINNNLWAEDSVSLHQFDQVHVWYVDTQWTFRWRHIPLVKKLIHPRTQGLRSSWPAGVKRATWKDPIWSPELADFQLNCACPAFKWMTNKLLGILLPAICHLVMNHACNCVLMEKGKNLTLHNFLFHLTKHVTS